MVMKIIRFTCYEVIVPAKPSVIASASIHKPLHKLPVGIQSGWSVQFDQLPKLILKLVLDNGIIGWGELYRNHDWRTVEQICNSLLGRSIDTLTLQRLPFSFCREYDGFECAIYDAFAKCHNLQVVDLLGGAIRNKIKIGAWSSHREADEVGSLAAQYSEAGYDCLKFKTDLDDDVGEWCRQIADYAPGMQVILDPNERWMSSSHTRRRIDELKETGNVLCLEDPIPRWQLNEYAHLRNYGPIPIVLHVSLPYILHGQRVSDAIQAIQAKAVDGFNFNGGIAKFQQLAHIAEAAELPFWHGSEVDLGILEAMYVHCAAAADLCIWPSDIFGRMIREHDLLRTPLDIQPPWVTLPEDVGLGVEIDEAALHHYGQETREFNI